MILLLRSSKTWCITLIFAIAVLVADKGQLKYVFVTLVPIALFWCLDSYYLGLERKFRDLYNAFIRKLHEGNARIEDAFIEPRTEIGTESARVP